MFFLLDPI